jgi:hypothetical protein
MDGFRTAIAAAALLLGTGGAWACPLAGTYAANGQVDGGAAYAGQAVISSGPGGHCKIVWAPPIGAQGTGTVIGARFSARFTIDGSTGSVLYDIGSGGVLTGAWSIDNEGTTGRETLTPVRTTGSQPSPAPAPAPPSAGQAAVPDAALEAMRTRRGERFGAIRRLGPVRAKLTELLDPAKLALLDELRLESPPETRGERTVWRACFRGACAQGNAAILADFGTGEWAVCLTDIGLGWRGEVWAAPGWPRAVTLAPPQVDAYSGCAVPGSTEAIHPATVDILFQRRDEAKAAAR